ncbi:hypothetical protein HIM_02476 [Hirsutella minnesotensis 3608]|nr:hypothetical protein HIM_02476 [Hirsutella minnesotensis 3608]
MAATQSSFASHRDAPSVAYRSQQPPSPTLTNPDMILPDYDHADSFQDLAHTSSMWTMSHTGGVDFSSLARDGYHAMPLGPTTPIIYGNGTMLSDIGEVTEVESIASSPPRRAISHLSGTNSDGTPLRSSPTMGRKPLKQRAVRERRLSLESASTANENPRPTTLGDYDNSASVDDSNFQGDDEESMASSYVDDHRPSAHVAAARPPAPADSVSQRAEHILANAKRRLTTMEGNLSRARNFGNSSSSEGSAPSPVAQTFTPPNENVSPTSAHLSSENTWQLPARPRVHLQRSASALGAAGGYRQPLSPGSADAPANRRVSSSNKLPYHPLDTSLPPLSEDGGGVGRIVEKRETSRSVSISSPTLSSYSDAGMTRAVSVAQVRDLQDQMQGLKGKISSLREQARADSMKRRSFQGLRTPSPFTHARWDQGAMEPRTITAVTEDAISPEFDQTRNATALVPHRNLELDAAKTEDAQIAADDDAPSVTGTFHEAQETQEGVDPVAMVEAEALEEEDASVETESEYFDDESEQDLQDDEAVQDDEDDTDKWSESGESLYHDTYQHPISHEDREDAFDYERFFLHSAMGTISRRGHGRRDSFASDDSGDSVETTRGPTLTQARRLSIDTFTTIDSFKTATEGRSSRASAYDADDGEELATSSSDDQAASIQDHEVVNGALDDYAGSGSDEGHQWQHTRQRQNSVLHRPIESNATNTTTKLHRPSISSFESTGTNRSFPLVNRVKMNGGIPTPMGSPEQDVKQISASIISETASLCDRESINGDAHPPAIQQLSKEDQAMVERVVASLGRCVLGLTEASRTRSGDEEEFRRRIDAARKILEAGNAS